MAIRNPVSWLQLRDDHTAENDRLTFASILAGDVDTGNRLNQSAGGVRWDDGNSFKARANSPAGMSVVVSAGFAYAPSTQANAGGIYTVINDADVSVTVNNSDSSQARVDIVYVYVEDGDYSGTDNDGAIGYTAGTPGGAAPDLPENAVGICQITVPANATSIVTANIVDVRKPVVTIGGIMPISPSTTRPYPGAYKGRAVYNEDSKAVEIHDGTNWVPQDAGQARAKMLRTGTSVSYPAYTETAPNDGAKTFTLASPQQVLYLYKVAVASNNANGVRVRIRRANGSSSPGTGGTIVSLSRQARGSMDGWIIEGWADEALAAGTYTVAITLEFLGDSGTLDNAVTCEILVVSLGHQL